MKNYRIKKLMVFLAAALLLLPCLAWGQVYFAHHEGIYRAQLNGIVTKTIPDPNNHFFVGGLAVDSLNNALYWAEWSPFAVSRIRRASLNGISPKILIDSLWYPTGLLLDLPNEHLYFADWTTIWRSNLDGSHRIPIVTMPALPVGICADFERGVLFYMTADTAKTDFFRLDLNDSVLLPKHAFSVEGFRNAHLALDPAHQRLFWSNFGDQSYVCSADYDGQNFAQLYVPLPPVAVGPLGLAYNPATERLYYTYHATDMLQNREQLFMVETAINGFAKRTIATIDMPTGIVVGEMYVALNLSGLYFETNDHPNIKIYPNPATHDFLIIEIIDYKLPIAGKIVDVQGKIMANFEINDLETKVDTSQFAANVYYVLIYANNKVFQWEIVKTH